MKEVRLSRRSFLGCSMGLLSYAAVAPAHAQSSAWRPTRPIHIVVPYPPGGGIDIVARFIAPGMESRLGQSIIIENRSGAVGMIGSEMVYRAAPDGYTFVMASADTHSINPHVYPDIHYDARAFAPAAAIATLDYMLVGRPDLEARDIKELIDLGHKRELTFASSGVGSSAHLVMEALKSRNHLRMLHIPYGGSAPAATAVMGSQVDLAMLPIAVALASRAKLKIYGVASAQRFDGAPDIPSLAEQGFPIDVQAAWIGLMAPPKTPQPILQAVNAVVADIVREPASKKRLADLGLAPYTASVSEFAAHVNAEYDRWGKIVREAGIKADTPK